MLTGVGDVMNELKDLVIFSLENQQFALHLLYGGKDCAGS